LNCEAFRDRLYDNDARAAGRGLGNIPSDMAAHMLACDACRAAYDTARADDLLLTRALVDVPSPAWRSDVLREMARAPHASWSRRIASVNEVVIWGVLAVAASQILLGESSTSAYVAAFGAGGAAALLRRSLTKHWQMLRRPLRWV
jgi:predicted anti-sigma-YlaC factor YlaD